MNLIIAASFTLLMSALSTNGHPAAAASQNRNKRASNELKRVCYFASWAQYRPGIGKYTMNDVDPSLCTHLIFAFGKLENNAITNYEWNDEQVWGIMQEKKQQNPNLKCLLAIGGWNAGTIEYTATVSSASNRQAFINQAISYLRQHKFDGLDIDWEYPGSRGSPATDKPKFTAWVKELKEAFRAEAQSTGSEELLLTAAIPVGRSTIDAGYEISKISMYLDFLNLMAYDLHGSWEPFTGLQTALYDTSNPVLSVNYAVNYLLDNGCPASKVVLGMGLYGRGWKLSDPSNNGIGAPTSGASTAGTFTGEPGYLAYYEVCSNGWPSVFSEVHKVPYAFSGNQWVGYDNVEGLTIKANYVIDKQLGGAMFWSMDLDDFGQNCAGSTRSYPLINAVKDIFNGVSPPTAPSTSARTTRSGSAITTTTSPSGSSSTQSTSTTTTTEAPPSGSSNCQYIAAGAWAGQASMDVWCQNNCALGSCPESHCQEVCS